MTEAKAKQLKRGSRVCWDNDPRAGGTVIEIGCNACKAKWDDPSTGEVSLLYFSEMANIGSLPSKK